MCVACESARRTVRGAARHSSRSSAASTPRRWSKAILPRSCSASASRSSDGGSVSTDVSSRSAGSRAPASRFALAAANVRLAERAVRREERGPFEECGRGQETATRLRSTGRLLEFDGDAFVVSDRRTCSMPRPPVRVEDRICYLRRARGAPRGASESVPRGRRPPNERVAEAHPLSELDESRAFRGRGGAPVESRAVERPPTATRDRPWAPRRRVSAGFACRGNSASRLANASSSCPPSGMPSNPDSPSTSSAVVHARGSSSNASGFPRVSAMIRSRTTGSVGPVTTESNSTPASSAPRPRDRAPGARRDRRRFDATSCDHDALARRRAAGRRIRSFAPRAVEPLRVVDDPHDWLRAAAHADELEDRHADEEPIGRRTGRPTEHGFERVAIGLGQPDRWSSIGSQSCWSPAYGSSISDSTPRPGRHRSRAPCLRGRRRAPTSRSRPRPERRSLRPAHPSRVAAPRTAPALGRGPAGRGSLEPREPSDPTATRRLGRVSCRSTMDASISPLTAVTAAQSPRGSNGCGSAVRHAVLHRGSHPL